MIRLIVRNAPVGEPGDDLRPLIRSEVQRQMDENPGGDVSIAFQISPDPRDDWWVFQIGGYSAKATMKPMADLITDRAMMALEDKNLI